MLFRSTPGSDTLWTFSFWTKRGLVDGNAYRVLNADYAGNVNWGGIDFGLTGDNAFEVHSYGTSSYRYKVVTTRQYRDPSAWYHIVVLYDSANSIISATKDVLKETQTLVTTATATVTKAATALPVALSGTNSSDIIIAGRMTQPTPSGEWGNFKLSILSWQNGSLVDKTSQWFPNDTNIILGTEPSVKTTDFFKTGRTDLFLSTGTDMQHYGPTYFYRNTGTSFERQVLTSANIWSHDSAIGDLNGDGYTDIAIIDYGTNTTLAFNNKVNGFNTYTQAQNIINGYTNVAINGGSSIAIGDFLQNGQGQIIVTDTPGNAGSNPTRMYSWSINARNELNFTELSTLPTPRFELPKWAGYGFIQGSHNVRDRKSTRLNSSH